MESTVNIFSGDGWRLIHNEKKVMTEPFFSSGVTKTKWKIEVFPTKEECIARILELNLQYAPISNAKKEVDNYLNSLG